MREEIPNFQCWIGSPVESLLTWYTYLLQFPILDFSINQRSEGRNGDIIYFYKKTNDTLLNSVDSSVYK